MNSTNTSIRWIKRMLATAAAAILFIVLLGGATPPQGRNVAIVHQDKAETEFALVWLGISNATYSVERRTNLLAGAWDAWSPWRALISGMVTWQIEDAPELPSRFFKVQFPTPAITGGEPAFVPQASGTTVYVTGQYFYEGDQIRMDGVLLTNVVFLSHNLLSGELPDLSPGLHKIDVVNGVSGNVLAALPDALQVSPPFDRTVQGPPEWPLAGPTSQRGVVTPRDPASGQATGKRIHSPRSSGSGLPTGRRMHSPFVSLNSPDDPNATGYLDDDCDGDILDTDSDDDGLLDVCLFSGEVRQQVVDLAVPGRGLDFVWGRTYRSRTGAASSQGNRWSHSYDVRCVESIAGGADRDIFDGTGRKDTFRLQANGTYTCPELFREGTLDLATGIFRLTFADTGYWEFNPLNASFAAGKLARIVDRNNNTITLAYDATSRLTEIVDDLGRTNTVAYTVDSQVASVTDFSGRTVTYAYYSAGESDGSPGDLKSVTSPPVTGTSTTNNFSAGKTTTYTYTTNTAAGAGSLLSSVRDALEQTSVQCTYDLVAGSEIFGRCVSIQAGTNSAMRVTYLPQTPVSDNRFAAMRCIVNDPEGNVSEHDFDLRNRCVALREYTGRALPGQPVTASANRPADKLRVDDPDVFTTTLSWNNDSLCTAYTAPRGDRVEWAYQSDLDPTTAPRFRANLRTERCISIGDLDGDGDLDWVVRSFEHDPRFGSERRGARIGRNPQTGKEIKIAAKKVAKFKAGKALADTVKSRMADSGLGEPCDDGSSGGDDVARVTFSAGNGVAIKTKGTGADNNRVAGGGDNHGNEGDIDCGGFVTRVVNARGFETRCEYDAQGNPTARMALGSEVVAGELHILAREDFEHNDYGQLTAYIHAESSPGSRRRDTCSYYTDGPQAGYLSSIAIDESGVHLTTSYAHDVCGNVTNTVDARGTVTTIEVNALGQVVAQVTQGASTSERAAFRCYYDAANNLVRSDIENRDGDGTLNPTNAWFATLYDYDVLHQLTRLVEADGSLTNTFAYNGNGQLMLASSPLAVQGSDPFHAIGYEYDERGLLFRETCAPGSLLQATTQYDYDCNGRLHAARAGIEDADGVRVTACAYDGFGRCASVIDPMGNETRFEYDLNDNLVCLTVYGETNDVLGKVGNVRLSETRYAYDALDRIVWYRDAFFDVFTQAPLDDGWRDTFIVYAPNGLVTATTNDRGHGTFYTFDTTMFLTAIVDAKTNRVDYSYDANHNLLSATETGRNDLGGPDEVLTRTFRYDALDRCVADWDNVGNTNRYAYDSHGNRVRHTDELGFNLEGDFDSVSRPTSNRKGIGGSAQNTTRFVWDAASRLVAEIDANTNTTAYAYDSLDRLVCTTLADGTSQTNAYDVHGNLVWTRDANGTEIFMTYDALDRCVLKNITPGEGVASDTTTESCQYDGLSRLVLAANDHTTVTREYDSLGRCVHEATSSSAFGFNPQEVTATRRVFDAHGLLLSQTLPSGRVVEYEYDAIDCPVWMGWSATAAEEPMPLAAFAYAGPDRLARVSRANGVETSYAYSGLVGVTNAPSDYGWGQVRRISHTLPGMAPIDVREFAYDRKQNKTVRAQVEPYVASGPTNLQAFTYDSLDQLVNSVTTTNGVDVRYRDYTFDAVGNRTYLKLARNAAPEPYTLDPTLPDPGDLQVNQYTTTPLDARQYDDQGNLIQTMSGDPASPVTILFVYDYADRLVAVTNAVGPVAVYAYDALGRRIAKVRYDEATGTPVLTNRYLYADGHVVEEEDGGGATLRSYAFPHVFDQKGRISGTFDTTMFYTYGEVIDGGGVVLFPLGDDQGSLLALTDAKGDVVGRFDYDDYGTPSFLDADGKPVPALDGNPYLFQGMHWDAETGLYWDGGSNPSTQMNKGELIDAMAKEAGFSQRRLYDPGIGRSLSRPYGGNNPYSTPQGSLKGPVPPYCPTFGRPPLTAHLPGGAIISAAVSVVASVGGGGKAQDHNSSRSNKTAALSDRGGGGDGTSPVGLIVPIAINKGLRFKGGHGGAMSSIRNIK